MILITKKKEEKKRKIPRYPSTYILYIKTMSKKYVIVIVWPPL